MNFFYKNKNNKQVTMAISKTKPHPFRLLIKLLGETEQNWNILTNEEQKLVFEFLKEYEETFNG